METNFKWDEYFISNDDEVPVEFTITIGGEYMADKGEKVSHARIVDMIYNDRFSQNQALYNGDFEMSVSSEFIEKKGKNE